MPAPAPATCSSDTYRRDARRLRGRWVGQPGRLQRGLKALADRHDAVGPPAPLSPDCVPAPRAGEFAARVADELRREGPVLRHRRRQALIAAAERAGIDRFQANLVIAAAQHQLRKKGKKGTFTFLGLAKNVNVPFFCFSEHPRPARGAPPIVAALMIALSVQALIAWGAWQVFLR